MKFKLTFSTEDKETIAICEQYWELTNDGKFKLSVKDLAEKAGKTPSKIAYLVRNSCLAHSDITTCSKCEALYTFSSRTEFNSLKALKDWTCKECMELEWIEEQVKKVQAEEEKKQRIVSTLKNSLDISIAKNPLRIDTLDTREKIQLMSLIRHCSTEDISTLSSLNTIEDGTQLTAGRQQDAQLVENLYKKNHISIDPDSNPKHFSLLDEGRFRFNLEQVDWILPLNLSETTPSFFYNELDSLLKSDSYKSDHQSEIIELCKESALYECLAFLQESLAKHTFNFNPGDKTILTVNYGLKHFSVARMYNLIWSAAKDVAAYFTRAGISKRQAANTIVKILHEKIERALANGWEVGSFRRRFDLPQSTYSKVLFNTILGTDDGGFHLSIGEIEDQCFTCDHVTDSTNC